VCKASQVVQYKSGRFKGPLGKNYPFLVHHR
jgi:hypothetical protein